MVLTSLKRPADYVLDPKEWWPPLPWRLEKTDIERWPAFCRDLIAQSKSDQPSPGKRIWELIEAERHGAFVEVSKRQPPPRSGETPRADQIILEIEYRKMSVALHHVFRRRDFYNERDFPVIEVPEWSKRILADPEADVDRVALAKRKIFDVSLPKSVSSIHRLQWTNDKYVVMDTNFCRALFNSAFMTFAVTFGSVFTSSLAAFAFARLNWLGRNKVFIAYLGTMMIPSAVTLIPTLILMRNLGWVNTYWGLIVPGIFTAWGTFMLRQFSCRSRATWRTRPC